MKDIQTLYNVLRPLTSQPECHSCMLCEEHVGLVYLLDNEAGRIEEAVKKDGRELRVLKTSQGVEYLGRTRDGWCSFFDPSKNICLIYQDRPLCCRIYPLDLMNVDGAVWWVIHAECPIAQRFQTERRLSVLAAMTAAMELALSNENLQHWLTQDRSSQAIEAFSFDETKTIKLRRYGEPIVFP